MRQGDQQRHSRFMCKKADGYLALFWTAGLIFGAWLHRPIGTDYSDLYIAAAGSHVPFTNLLLCTCLPFLISAFPVINHAPFLLYGICFFKALSLSFVSCLVSSAFGGPGWLVRSLLLFSDMCSSAILYWFCRRFISGECRLSRACAAGCMAVLFLVVCIDYHFIFPFLQRILI